ncbi:MAG: sugar ABC transporter permease, partial [Clostridia bacterium]|nr:sugar ABC transporter permease [Clostridia bacterium]
MSDMTKGTNQFASPKEKGFFSTLASQWQLALMSVPIFLYVILFNYVPLWGWSNAFKDYGNRKLVARGITPWNGLENFKWLFSRPDFYQAIRNTLAMSLINLVFGTVAAIVLAVLLNEVRQRAFKRTVQTVTYLPHFLSMVIIVAMAQNIFASNGPVNDLLKLLGLQPVFWLGEGKHFWWLVGIINVWKEVGWGTIIYISAMTSIDPSLYEAAGIDGAGRFQKILHVTLPGIKSTFVILLIMNIGHLMEAGFEIQYLLGNGLTAEFSRTIDIFVLEYGTQQMDFGVATAA